MSASFAVQLMVGQEELEKFSREEIISRLKRSVKKAGFERIFLSFYDLSPSFSMAIIEECKKLNLKTSLWTMTLADNSFSTTAPFVPSQALGGQSREPLWGLDKDGFESFNFSCPVQFRNDHQAVEKALLRAETLGVSSLFLDRIRYPSVVSGFAYFGSCMCEHCRKQYQEQYDSELPDMAAIAVNLARGGRDGAREFLDRTRDIARFRAETIVKICRLYSAGRLKVETGLDLFSPSIALLVGQDYRLLADEADFFKSMIYTQANAPAGIPLELNCFIKGLVKAGVPFIKAVLFTSELTGFTPGSLVKNWLKPGLNPAIAGSEIKKALSITGIPDKATRLDEIYAGIELVDYADYETRVGPLARDKYLKSLKGRSIAACWNLLYIPESHFMALADSRKG